MLHVQVQAEGGKIQVGSVLRVLWVQAEAGQAKGGNMLHIQAKVGNVLHILRV